MSHEIITKVPLPFGDHMEVRKDGDGLSYAVESKVAKRYPRPDARSALDVSYAELCYSEDFLTKTAREVEQCVVRSLDPEAQGPEVEPTCGTCGDFVQDECPVCISWEDAE